MTRETLVKQGAVTIGAVGSYAFRANVLENLPVLPLQKAEDPYLGYLQSSVRQEVRRKEQVRDLLLRKGWMYRKPGEVEDPDVVWRRENRDKMAAAAAATPKKGQKTKNASKAGSPGSRRQSAMVGGPSSPADDTNGSAGTTTVKFGNNGGPDQQELNNIEERKPDPQLCRTYPLVGPPEKFGEHIEVLPTRFYSHKFEQFDVEQAESPERCRKEVEDWPAVIDEEEKNLKKRLLLGKLVELEMKKFSYKEIWESDFYLRYRGRGLGLPTDEDKAKWARKWKKEDVEDKKEDAPNATSTFTADALERAAAAAADENFALHERPYQSYVAIFKNKTFENHLLDLKRKEQEAEYEAHGVSQKQKSLKKTRVDQWGSVVPSFSDDEKEEEEVDLDEITTCEKAEEELEKVYAQERKEQERAEWRAQKKQALSLRQIRIEREEQERIEEEARLEEEKRLEEELAQRKLEEGSLVSGGTSGTGTSKKSGKSGKSGSRRGSVTGSEKSGQSKSSGGSSSSKSGRGGKDKKSSSKEKSGEDGDGEKSASRSGSKGRDGEEDKKLGSSVTKKPDDAPDPRATEIRPLTAATTAGHLTDAETRPLTAATSARPDTAGSALTAATIDFEETFFDEAGKIVPSPGMEREEEEAPPPEPTEEEKRQASKNALNRFRRGVEKVALTQMIQKMLGKTDAEVGGSIRGKEDYRVVGTRTSSIFGCISAMSDEMITRSVGLNSVSVERLEL